MADAPKFTVEFGMDGPPPDDGRLDAPAFHRNQEAIGQNLEILLQGRTGDVLEIGSGTGQHAMAFASRMPSITWWPTDFNDHHLRSIAAWRRHANLPNLKEPVLLDASAADWPLRERGLPERFTAIFCANVIHIAPWAVTEGLFAGASRHLRGGGELRLYGPFQRDGAHNAPSNAAFDESLRRQNPEWGVRDTADLTGLARRNNLRLLRTYELPSNNAILAFEQLRQ